MQFDMNNPTHPLHIANPLNPNSPLNLLERKKEAERAERCGTSPPGNAAKSKFLEEVRKFQADLPRLGWEQASRKWLARIDHANRVRRSSLRGRPSRHDDAFGRFAEALIAALRANGAPPALERLEDAERNLKNCR